MKTKVLVTVFALAVLTLRAQNPQGHKPKPPVAQVQPPLPPPGYSFTAIVAPGLIIGGHTFTPDNTIENSTAFSDTGVAAFVAGWNDPETGKQTRAVFTTQRRIALEGDVLEGKMLVFINAASLSMNNTGTVAFECVYSDASTPTVTKTGVFIERRYIGDITPSANGIDFVFLDDGRILSHDGTIVGLPAPHPAVAVAAAQTPAASNTPPPQQPKKSGFGIHLSKKIQDMINKNSPVQIDPGMLSGIGGNTDTSPQPKQQAAAAPPPAQPQPARTPALPIPPFPVTRTASCPVPAFPLPANWQIGADGSGPIASHGFEGTIQGRIYDSPLFGKLLHPIRTIQYASDCRALLIAIGDSNSKGRFEVWTPEGFLTYAKPDGTWNFPGIPMNVTSAVFLREHSGLRINRSGQLLLPVSLAQGSALLLATPSH